MTLILDHIDGCHNNDEITNLRWVCPNCNSQLETTGWRGYRQQQIKDKCKKKIPASEKFIRISVEEEEAERQKNNKAIDSNRLKHKKCKRCGKEITDRSTYCRECAEEVKRENRLKKTERLISRDELKKMVRKNKLTDVKNILGISEYVIKRILRNYKLPEHKTEIDSYSDEEWEKL